MELKNLSLSDISGDESKMINGGCWALLAAVGLYMIYEAAGNPESSWNAFKAGWYSVAY